MPASKLIHGVSTLFLFSILAACGSSPPASSTPIEIPTFVIPSSAVCTSFTAEPTPGPETPSLFPPITEADHVRGPADAPITILDYSDYQDPRSGALAEVLRRLLAENPEDIRFVSRPFPVFVVNDKSAYAALAAEAAAEQGKFWEMHDHLFTQQSNWLDLSVDDFKQWIVAQLSLLDLDAEQFKSDYAREDVIARVQKAWEDGTNINIPGTPIMVINSDLYQGPRDYASLNDVTQLILLGERQFTTCPSVTVNPTAQYIATLRTEKGDVVLQLFADKAPYTVNSFIFLAENGWYDNITFHRVIPNLFAQTGDPSGTGRGNPGYYLITEILPNLTFISPGMVAMVNSGPDTSGSQFFITYGQATQFDGQYTIFGQVIKGMEVLKALTPRDAQPGVYTPPGDKLLEVIVEEN